MRACRPPSAPRRLGNQSSTCAGALRGHRCGRASSAPSSPRRCSRAGHDVVGFDCFTDYYDPRAEGRERARPRRPAASTSPRARSTSRGLDGVFHLAGQPGVRSFGDVFPLYVRRNVLASQRVFEAAVARRGPGRVRLLVVGVRRARAVSDARGRAAASALAVRRSRSSRASSCSMHTSASFGLDAVVLRYFNAFGPRQRPDMAFTRIAFALAAGTRFELYGDGVAVAQLDVRRRRGRRDDPRDGARVPGRTTSAARSRRR